MSVQDRRDNFIIIGENIHTTRIVLRKGRFVVQGEDGVERIRFTTSDGDRFLNVPEKMQRSADFEEGRVKYVQAGILAAMSDNAEEVETGMAFLQNLVRRQVEAGAHFLDLNVDEISIRRKEQEAAMRWLVPTIAGMCDTPLSVDSSCIGTIAAGLEAAGSDRAVMLNSASLERLDALDLAVQYNSHVIATAAGADGMPQNTEERFINASQVVDAAVAKGIPLNRIYIDPLIFPISVDAEFGIHCLEAIRQLREKYGSEVHISGGFSNVSFGIPMRRLVNDVFTNLAVEAGADSGIIDPVTSPLARVFSADRESGPYKLAESMLLGNDEFCKTYLKAFRAGELK